MDTVNRFVSQIIANGRYEPPRLGVRFDSELSDAVTSRLGIQGVLILAVVSGEGAEQAGLRGTVIGRSDLVQLGDILQKIDDKEIGSMNDMLQTLERYRAGNKVVVEFLREGETKTAEVELR